MEAAGVGFSKYKLSIINNWNKLKIKKRPFNWFNLKKNKDNVFAKKNKNLMIGF